MVEPKHEQLARKMLGAYEAKDIEFIASLFSSDVLLRDWNHEVVGRTAAIREFTKNFEEAQQLSIKVLRIFGSEAGVAAEVEIVVNNSEVLRVIDVISFNVDSKITSIISYKGL
jgi:hypothetical protein